MLCCQQARERTMQYTHRCRALLTGRVLVRRCSLYNVANGHEVGAKQHKVRVRVPPVGHKCARRCAIRSATAVESEPKNNRGHLEQRQDNTAKCQDTLRETLLAAAEAEGMEGSRCRRTGRLRLECGVADCLRRDPAWPR